MWKVRVVNAAVLAAAILMLSAVADGRRSYENVDVVHIDGKVLCQDCNDGWNEWMNGKPLKGAEVAVTCLDSRRRAVYHASDVTDDKGEFDLLLNKQACGRTIKPEDCTVRLASSPDAACNVMTNFGGGKNGVKPHHPTLVHAGLVKYTVGPFYFTSPACEEPDTSNHDDDDDEISK